MKNQTKFDGIEISIVIIIIFILICLLFTAFEALKRDVGLPATLSQTQSHVPVVIMEHDVDEDGIVDYTSTYYFNGERCIELKRVYKDK